MPITKARAITCLALLGLWSLGSAQGSDGTSAPPSDLGELHGTWVGELALVDGDGAFIGGGTPIDLVLHRAVTTGDVIGVLRILDRQSWEILDECPLRLDEARPGSWRLVTDCEPFRVVHVEYVQDVHGLNLEVDPEAEREDGWRNLAFLERTEMEPGATAPEFADTASGRSVGTICPDDLRGARGLGTYLGTEAQGWPLTAGRNDLFGRVRLGFPDGTATCYSSRGGHVTFGAIVAQTQAGTPTTHLLVQEHGLRRCEQRIEVWALDRAPRVVFRERWEPEGGVLGAVCPARVVDIDDDGTDEILVFADHWTSPAGSPLPSCSHALAPYVPAVLTFDGTWYRIADPTDAAAPVGPQALHAVYDEYLGTYLRAYASLRAESPDAQARLQLRCVVTALALPWFFLREPTHALALLDALVDDGDERDDLWAALLESVAANRYIGHWYR